MSPTETSLNCSYGHYKDTNNLQSLFQSIRQGKAKKAGYHNQTTESLSSSSNFSLSHEILFVPYLRGQTTLKDTELKGGNSYL